LKRLKFYSYEYDEACERLLAEVQNGFHMLDPVLQLSAQVEDFGFASYAALMLLLRDRYFPGLWLMALRSSD